MKTKFVVLKVNFFVLFFLLFPSAIWTYGLPHLPNEEAQRILHSVKIIRNKTHNIIGGYPFSLSHGYPFTYYAVLFTPITSWIVIYINWTALTKNHTQSHTHMQVQYTTDKNK